MAIVRPVLKKVDQVSIVQMILWGHQTFEAGEDHPTDYIDG